MQKEYIKERFIDYAVRIILLSESLPIKKVRNHILGQILRSGNFPATNSREGISAESRNDFIHKL